jgi:hypothetical protein
MKQLLPIKCLLFLLLFSAKIIGQDSLKHSRKYYLESNLLVSSADKTPFWLRTNTLGIVPNTGTNFMLRGGISQGYNLKPKRYDWGYGLGVVANVNFDGVDALLPEAYIKAKAGIFEIWAGRRREVFGLTDSSNIGTGSVTWSGNALPMTKIQFGTPNFVNIAFKGLLAVKVSYAHGWFDNGVVKDYYLHQKSFYGRIGREKAKFKFYAGLTHNVQWGGIKTFPDGSKEYHSNDWVAFSAVNIPVKDKFWLKGVDFTKYPAFDTGYEFGNHSGSFDLGFEIQGKNRRIFVYKQSPFEYLATNSGVTEFEDGVYGLKITNFNNKAIQEISTEFIYTLNQSRYVTGFFSLLGLKPERWESDDNYGNHGQYTDGWVYQDKSIGSPFIIPRKDYVNKSGEDSFQDALLTNLVVFHLGMKGTLTSKQIQYQLKMSHTKNYIRNLDIPSSQFSLGVFTATPSNLLGGSELLANLGFDTGKVFTNSIGLSVGLRKSW